MFISSKPPSAKPSLFLLAASLLLPSCSTFLPNSGPSAHNVYAERKNLAASNIQVVPLTPEVVRDINAQQKVPLFSDQFATGASKTSILRAGDGLEVSVFEAPPASLFGGAGGLTGGAISSSIPEQVINSEGSISIPFAGKLNVAGLRVRDIEEQISTQLRGKANQPQVLVRQTRNANSLVTVVGETTNSIRMPLTPANERVLDALASAGGFRQQVSKITIQITRGSKVVALPLETIIADPRQNIPLQPGDVVTALSQPLSFTALGATGKNDEISFEAKGINLTQALARAGGLSDSRSNSRGVFVFRFEDTSIAAIAASKSGHPLKTSQNARQTKTPVIYSLNLRDPSSFFLAKNFPVKDGDTLFISNAPAAEIQKFMNLVSTVAAPMMMGLNASSIINN